MRYDLEIRADGGWIRTGFIGLGGPVVMQIDDGSTPAHRFTLYVSHRFTLHVSDILAIAEKLENPPSFGSSVAFSSGFIQIYSDGAFVIRMEADNIARSRMTQLRLTVDQAKELAAWLRSYIPKVPIPTWQDKAKARRDKGLKGVFG